MVWKKILQFLFLLYINICPQIVRNILDIIGAKCFKMVDRKLYIDLFDTLADFEGAIVQSYGRGSINIDPSFKYGKFFLSHNKYCRSTHYCVYM